MRNLIEFPITQDEKKRALEYAISVLIKELPPGNVTAAALFAIRRDLFGEAPGDALAILYSTPKEP